MSHSTYCIAWNAEPFLHERSRLKVKLLATPKALFRRLILHRPFYVKILADVQKLNVYIEHEMRWKSCKLEENLIYI
jgi:hypothetical protein